MLSIKSVHTLSCFLKQFICTHWRLDQRISSFFIMWVVIIETSHLFFRAVLLRAFVWIKAEGPLYLLATVATNTEVCSLLPSEERRWKGEPRKSQNYPNMRLHFFEIEGKTRHKSPNNISFMSANPLWFKLDSLSLPDMPFFTKLTAEFTDRS